MIDRCHNTTRDILEWIDGNKRNTFRTGRNVRCVHCTMGQDLLPYIVYIGMCHGIGYGLVSGHLATREFHHQETISPPNKVYSPPIIL